MNIEKKGQHVKNDDIAKVFKLRNFSPYALKFKITRSINNIIVLLKGEIEIYKFDFEYFARLSMQYLDLIYETNLYLIEDKEKALAVSNAIDELVKINENLIYYLPEEIRGNKTDLMDLDNLTFNKTDTKFAHFLTPLPPEDENTKPPETIYNFDQKLNDRSSQLTRKEREDYEDLRLKYEQMDNLGYTIKSYLDYEVKGVIRKIRLNLETKPST